MTSYRTMLESFDNASLPNLDEVVMGALELLSETPLPQINLSVYQRPLIVGSGNAEATGRILFEHTNASFASESTYVQKLRDTPDIDGVVIVSASGEKHAPIIARTCRDLNVHVTLVTTSRNSSASRELDHLHDYDEYVFPKNREPYTYNTSTYLGMVLGATGEDPREIQKYIETTIKPLHLPDFSAHDKFYIVVPAEFSLVTRMLHVKFIELFGRRIARDVETDEYSRHATTVVPSDELFISFGTQKTRLGTPDQQLYIPLPDRAGYGAMIAIGYYIIGRIQAAHPDYFKQNIASYIEHTNSTYDSNLTLIVDN